MSRIAEKENRRPPSVQIVRGKPQTEKPKVVKFKVSYDFYRLPDGIGDHVVRDDAFYHQGPCQVMYPKELVYPRGGGEVSLEMIRAGMDVYQVPVEDGNDSGMDFTCMPGDLIHNAKNLPVYKSRGNVGHHGQQAQVSPIKGSAPRHSSLNKLLQSQHLEKEALEHVPPEPPNPGQSSTRDNEVERGTALDQLLSERRSVPVNRERPAAAKPAHRHEHRGYMFTPQGGPAWNYPDPSGTNPQKMLSFSDSQSFSVSGMSACSNFSAYESSMSQAGGTFKVYEDSGCADQTSLRPSGKQSLRTSRAANLSSVMENTNQGSFQVYEDSMQSIHGSMRLGGSKAGPEVLPVPAVAEQLSSENSSRCHDRQDTVSAVKQAPSCRHALKVLKDTKISNSVDTESQLAEMFEVYPDLFAGDRVPRGADWLVPGQQGAAPTSTVAPPVEVEQAQPDLFPWIVEQDQPTTMHNAGDERGIQAAPLPTQPQAVFEESVTMMDIPRPLQPLSKFSSTPIHWEKTASVLPSLDVTNVQHELNKLKLDPSYPLTEPLKAPTEDQPAPAGLRGINALFHKPWPVSQRAHAGPPMDTIAEDRESYSSGSSAAMSVGAMNSTAGKNLCATNLSLAIPTPFYLAKGDAFFNPFKPEAVQFMLSAVAGNPMPRVDESPPEPLEQSHIDVGMKCHVMNKIGEGGFATIYKAVAADNFEVAVKFQQPADQWEYTILNEMHKRLDEEKPSIDKELFVKVLSACIMADTSVLVLPLYHCGTLLDLINSQPLVTEASALAFVADILRALSALHSIGILHGDIKPDNMFMREQGGGGPTLALGDFSRAVDLRAFPKDVAFTGTSYTSSFECEQMKRNEPWKYQVDTYATAMTVHILAHHNYNNFFVNYDERTKEYIARRKVPRYWHQSEWQDLLKFLLNTSTYEEPNFVPWIALLSELAHACGDPLID